jgi:hypothetical protein
MIVDYFNSFDNACIDCANWIIESDFVQQSYLEHVRNNTDHPSVHLFYKAHLVLGKEKLLKKDVENYLYSCYVNENNNY